MGRVNGKVALVTGAASGIGRAIAILLAKEGASVVATDIDRNGVDGTARLAGGDTMTLAHDVANIDEWAAVATAVRQRFGGLDILVNNAGTSGPRGPHDPVNTPREIWSAIYSVNLDGVVFGCQTAVPLMRERGGGAIVNIASLAARVATPNFAPYGTSKAAVVQYTKSLAIYCASAKYNIRCNSVLPGVIETPMSGEILGGSISRREVDTEAIRKKLLRTVPLGRFGRPEDVASAVLYLVSDEAAFVTGTEIIVDGGTDAAP